MPHHGHDQLDADVIIIGAGLSGMTAAHALHQAGVRVLIFDGKDRVGGRTWCDPGFDNGAIDYGGMFVGSTHARSIELGKSLGLELVKARPEGRAVWDLGGETLIAEPGRYPDKTLPDGSSLQAALSAAFGKIDTIAAEVGKDRPWAAPGAQALDALTMTTWLEQHVPDPLVRNIVGSDISIITGVNTSELSVLFFAFYVAQCENMAALQVTANTYLWAGGAGQMATRIADNVGAAAIRLNEPALMIDHSGQGACLTTLKGRYHARRVILALPPSAIARIHFTPELPDARRQLNRRTNMGRYMKLQLRYASRFWLQQGLSGEVFSLEPGYFALDVTRPGDTRATLVLFIGASCYDRWFNQGVETRRTEILRALSRALGAQALVPEDYIETAWNEIAFTMGGPVCHMPPGLLSTAGPALRASVGALHFAGTEAAPNWTGYMEGAVQAGEAAAIQIMAALTSEETTA